MVAADAENSLVLFELLHLLQLRYNKQLGNVPIIKLLNLAFVVRIQKIIVLGYQGWHSC